MRFEFLPGFVDRFVNLFVNARTYGIYISRAFVPSRFFMGLWLSTLGPDVSHNDQASGSLQPLRID
jgi:hypothetical protein